MSVLIWMLLVFYSNVMDLVKQIFETPKLLGTFFVHISQSCVLNEGGLDAGDSTYLGKVVLRKLLLLHRWCAF